MRRRKKESARPILICGSLKQGERRGKMKKLIYLIASILFALTSVYGVYDIFVTKQDDLIAGIMAVLFAAFLAWLFMHLFLKPEPRHKHQAANMPESSSEATSDAPTVETAPITHADANDGVEDDYVAIDIETTGLGRSARIIELGAVRIRHGRKVASFSQSSSTRRFRYRPRSRRSPASPTGTSKANPPSTKRYPSSTLSAVMIRG